MCRLAKESPCNAIDWKGNCTIFSPDGVLARVDRFKSCAYQSMRLEKTTKKKKINPLKASKAAAKG